MDILKLFKDDLPDMESEEYDAVVDILRTIQKDYVEIYNLGEPMFFTYVRLPNGINVLVKDGLIYISDLLSKKVYDFVTHLCHINRKAERDKLVGDIISTRKDLLISRYQVSYNPQKTCSVDITFNHYHKGTLRGDACINYPYYLSEDLEFKLMELLNV